MVEPGPLPRWCEDTCVVCPAQLLGPGRFDVVERPGGDNRYDPAIGYRVNAQDGTPVCVHPYRVGLPPGRYASAGEALAVLDGPAPAPPAAALELPEELVDLEAWLVAILRVAPVRMMASALEVAEATACERFAARDVTVALRRVFATELAGRS